MTSQSNILRKYIDIINEGPPPGIGPNAIPKPAANPQQSTQQRAADLDAGTDQATQGVEKISQGDRVGGAMDVAKGMNKTLSAAGLGFFDKLGMAWMGLKAGARAAWAGRKGDGNAAMNAGMASLAGEFLPQMYQYVNNPNFEKEFDAIMAQAKDSPDAAMQDLYQQYAAKQLNAKGLKNLINKQYAAYQDMKNNPATAKGFDSDANMYAEPAPASESINRKKSFLEHIEEVENDGDLVAGDGFIIETAEDEGVETYVIESWDDAILIAADGPTLRILEELGLLNEASPTVTPGAMPPTAGQPAAAAPRMDPDDPNAPIDPLWQKYNQLRGTLRSYDSLTGTQPGDKQTYSSIDPKAKAMIDQMKADLATAEKQLIAKGYTKQQLDKIFTPKPQPVQDLSKEYKWDDQIEEAKYQGRSVPLGKPMAGDVKKSKVYVKKPNGNIVKVNFGDKKMKIKKSNPKRRKSFRARHHCENPGPRWKARYWSCRAW